MKEIQKIIYIISNVDFLIATVNEMEINTNKVTRATSLDIPILSEQFLLDCLEKGRKMDHTKYLLTN